MTGGVERRTSPPVVRAGFLVLADPWGRGRRDIAAYAHPVLADTDRDGDSEIFVMYADGRVVALDYRN